MKNLKELMQKKVYVKPNDGILLIASFYIEQPSKLHISPSKNNPIITLAYVLKSGDEKYKPGDCIVLSEVDIADIDHHLIMDQISLDDYDIRHIGFISTSSVLGKVDKKIEDKK